PDAGPSLRARPGAQASRARPRTRRRATARAGPRPGRADTDAAKSSAVAVRAGAWFFLLVLSGVRLQHLVQLSSLIHPIGRLWQTWRPSLRAHIPDPHDPPALG